MDNNYIAPGLPSAENDPIFRQTLTTVSKNRQIKSEIEKYRFEEMANGFNDLDTIFLAEEWFDILEDLTEIHNPRPENNADGRPVSNRSRRTVSFYNKDNELVTMGYPYFDLSPSIELFFNRAKNRVVLMKSLDGKAVLNATESRHVHSSTERSYAVSGMQQNNLPFVPNNNNNQQNNFDKR